MDVQVAEIDVPIGVRRWTPNQGLVIRFEDFAPGESPHQVVRIDDLIRFAGAAPWNQEQNDESMGP